jgi:hypothetical protein
MSTDTAPVGTGSAGNAKLTVADIADVRAYERERDEFRSRIIALKALRRVHVGPLITLLFENRDTMRFQIQEMARAEKLVSDEQIQTELDIYNPLIPAPGSLSATLFIECTTDEEMRTWFPALVGIERAVDLVIGQGAEAVTVTCEPEAAHAAQLTREEMTSAVHYVHFTVGTEHADAVRDGPVVIRVTHPAYGHSTELPLATRAQLSMDIAG